jgi:hypothetical protein
VYMMRPAQAADRPQINALVTARMQWLGRHGVRGAMPDPALTLDAAGTRDAGGRPVAWVCHDEDGVLAGATCLLAEMPQGTWEGAELLEPALLLAGTWTNPQTRSDRVGALMAYWALGRAFEHGARWLRRITTSARLAEYAQGQQWVLQRSAYNGRTMQYLLARRALPLSGLDVLITAEAASIGSG